MEQPAVTVENIIEMADSSFPGSGNSCHEIGDDYVVAKRPVKPDDIRPGGFVSGPTQFALADAALWYATFVGIGRLEPMAMTSELSIHFLRPAVGDVLWARATIDLAGRRSVVGSVSIWTDDVDRPTSIAQGTYMLPHTPTVLDSD